MRLVLFVPNMSFYQVFLRDISSKLNMPKNQNIELSLRFEIDDQSAKKQIL